MAGDFGLGVALKDHARRRMRAPWVAGGLTVCALLLLPPTARADDSLWGKAMNTIGLGGASAPTQGAAAPQPAAPQQPAAPAPQSAPAPAAQAAPAPAAQAAPAPAAPADNQNILPSFFGWGRHDGAQPADQAALQPQGKAMTPVQTPAPAPAAEPGLWDRMLGNAGLNTNDPASNIYYADRPKLNVPKARALPPPAPLAGPSGVRPSNPADLVQPPGGYLEKVRGADGNVSGLRPGDIGKDKKFFGLF
ncbi:hypothetical protein [Rhodoblastus sp.]|uniref:hypothetical protein n=1 Tax=Rhodoblastus sp. TaxID=1962975 RepID=UPI003F9CF72A